MEIEVVKIKDMKPAEYNPRAISHEMLERLAKGIKEFGIVDPIVINKDGTIVGGHQRVLAAEMLGMTELPCVRLDLDKKKEKALNLALNKIAGEWDFPKLSAVLLEFDGVDGFDIELTGFDASEQLNISNSFSGFGAETLFDIFDKDLATKNSSKLMPASIIIASIGSFIEGVALKTIGTEKFDSGSTLINKFQLEAPPEIRADLAVKILNLALEEMGVWQKSI